ncbi:hypothetical protein D3C87_1394290 [compost metagenome]
MPQHSVILFWLILTLGQVSAVHAQTPPDVQAFAEHRDVCDVLRGEIPDVDKKERVEQVINDINQHCEGTDAALQNLKSKYADDTQVMSLLDQYEPTIETSQ